MSNNEKELYYEHMTRGMHSKYIIIRFISANVNVNVKMRGLQREVKEMHETV